MSRLLHWTLRPQWSRRLAHSLYSFDEGFYIENNPDICESGMYAIEHYLRYGRGEGRRPRLAGDGSRQRRPQQPVKGRAAALDAMRMNAGFPAYARDRGAGRDPSALSAGWTNSSITLSTYRAAIIVPVHNAAIATRTCLRALEQLAAAAFEVVVVDDGSSEELATWLKSWCGERQARYIRHEKAQGFPAACNAGISVTTAPWILLLNSDTYLPVPSWREMLAVAESSPGVGAVGPLSNAATYQSVPDVVTGGHWAKNEISRDVVSALAESLAAGELNWPDVPSIDVPMLNGFCVMIRRAAAIEAGLMDSVTFGAGYGEEVDLLLRMKHLGYRLVVASNAYCFHEGSASFGAEARGVRESQATESLTSLYPQMDWAALHDRLMDSRTLERRRADVWGWLRSTRSASGRPVAPVGSVPLEDGPGLYLLLFESGVSGGATVALNALEVMSEVTGLAGHVVNDERNKPGFMAAYGSKAAGKHLVWLPEGGSGELSGAIPRGAIVITTSHHSISRWIAVADVPGSHHRQTYVIELLQDDERVFSTDPKHFAQAHYSLDRLARLPRSSCWATTPSLARLAIDDFGLNASVVTPFVDAEIFSVRTQSSNDAFDLVGMVRPTTIRRAPHETSEFLSAAARRGFKVACFGSDDRELAEAGVILDGDVSVLGRIPSDVTAEILASSKMFVDLSFWQAFGLTSLEAMAMGCVPLANPSSGLFEVGVLADSFIPASPTRVAESVDKAVLLLEEQDGLRRHRTQAMRTAGLFTRERTERMAMAAMMASGLKDVVRCE